jgi:hypothetical protein
MWSNGEGYEFIAIEIDLGDDPSFAFDFVTFIPSCCGFHSIVKTTGVGADVRKLDVLLTLRVAFSNNNIEIELP